MDRADPRHPGAHPDRDHDLRAQFRARLVQGPAPRGGKTEAEPMAACAPAPGVNRPSPQAELDR